jgi:hypothetical protein
MPFLLGFAAPGKQFCGRRVVGQQASRQDQAEYGDTTPHKELTIQAAGACKRKIAENRRNERTATCANLIREAGTPRPGGQAE